MHDVIHPARQEISPHQLLLVAVPVLAFILALLAARPDQVGVHDDSIIYLQTAESLTQGRGLAVPSFPGEPQVAKYPLVTTLLFASVAWLDTGPGQWGLQLIFILQAGLFAAAVAVFVNVVMPLLGAGVMHRAVAAFLLGMNHWLVVLAISPLSEAAMLFVLALLCWVLLRYLNQPSCGRLMPLAALVALSIITRSVGVAFLVGILIILISRKDYRAVGFTFLTSAIVAAGERFARLLITSSHAPTVSTFDLPAYYQGYRFHLNYLLEPANLAQVIGHNLMLGGRTFLEFALPNVGLADGWAQGNWAISLIGWFIIVGLVVLLWWGKYCRALACMVVCSVALMLIWSWPFSTRFWHPVWPLLVVGSITAISRLRWKPVHLFAFTFACLIFLVNAWALFNTIMDRFEPLVTRYESAYSAGQSHPTKTDDPLTAYVVVQAWASSSAGPREQDVLLGGQITQWLARKAKCQGLWLRTLAGDQAMLDRYFRPADILKSDAITNQQSELVHQLQRLQASLPDDARIYIVSPLDPDPAILQIIRNLHASGQLQHLTVVENENINVYRFAGEAK